MEITRRQALAAIGGGGLAAVAATSIEGGCATAEAAVSDNPGRSSPAPAYRGTNEVKPLPFNAAKLTGLSEKLITSHHDNNYAGAVTRLNLIQQQIGSLAKDAAPYQLGALKREELIATNSMILHELYFGNLGGDGKASGTIVTLIKEQYGAFETWEAEFRLIGLSLAGGSGWVILDFDPHSAAVRTSWAGDHTQSLASGVPLLVMDMYEHSYQMDYGANAKSYVDAFFQNIDWAKVNQRTDEARGAGKKA